MITILTGQRLVVLIRLSQALNPMNAAAELVNAPKTTLVELAEGCVLVLQGHEKKRGDTVQDPEVHGVEGGAGSRGERAWNEEVTEERRG